MENDVNGVADGSSEVTGRDLRRRQHWRPCDGARGRREITMWGQIRTSGGMPGKEEEKRRFRPASFRSPNCTTGNAFSGGVPTDGIGLSLLVTAGDLKGMLRSDLFPLGIQDARSFRSTELGAGASGRSRMCTIPNVSRYGC